MSKVLVTGSSKGLGKELAAEFIQRGNEVITHGRTQAIPQNPQESYVKGDITQEETIRELIKKAEGLDILVNNIGVYFNMQASEMSMQELRRLMEVNFFSHINLTLQALPIFLAKGNGLIVNINSVAGINGSFGKSAYAASKHALRGFYDSLKYEVIKKGVRILNVYLGGMKTDMSQGRRDYDSLIDPKEAAKAIVDNCEPHPSLYIPELHMGRVKYDNQ